MVKKRSLFHYAVRRVKKRSDQTRAEKLFQAGMQSDIDLLKEMKIIRCGGNTTELPECVDGANGEEEIVEKFREVYSALYNSASTEADMSELKFKISGIIQAGSSAEVSKVTGSKVKEAL